MRNRRPSPAMVVALIALTVALSGTAVAAVDFVQRAGSVDGRSAVGADASLREAAGKLVATQRGGHGKGRISRRFLHGVMGGGSSTLSKFLRSTDNQVGRVTALAIIPGVGRLDAQCNDTDPAVGNQSTQTQVTFTASQASGVNVSRLLGEDINRAREATVFTAPQNQPVAVINRADSLFQLLLEVKGRTVFINGAARSEANPGPSPACLLWGIALRVG
jgi:hypothetical protein